MSPYLRLMRFDKPVGTLLLLWPCWWALALTTRFTQLHTWVIFTLGVVVMRAAGCVANDIADRNFDGKVERTQNRPLANGELSVGKAIKLLCALLCIALLLVWQLNFQTIALSFIGLILALTYPLMKRWIRGPQLFLGLAFSWSIPMVYTATDTQFEMSFVVLLATSILWPVIYDTFYAMPDKKDDLKIGIHSTAIWFGDATLHHLTNFQILLTIQLLSLGNQFSLSTAYYWGLVPVIATIAYQLYLGFQHKPELGFKAFKLSQWQGGFVFAAISAGIIL